MSVFLSFGQSVSKSGNFSCCACANFSCFSYILLSSPTPAPLSRQRSETFDSIWIRDRLTLPHYSQMLPHTGLLLVIMWRLPQLTRLGHATTCQCLIKRKSSALATLVTLSADNMLSMKLIMHQVSIISG